MKPVASYLSDLRADRDKRILHLHRLGDTSLQIATRLGTTSSQVNKVIRRANLEPNYPYEGLTVLDGRKRKKRKERTT